MISKTKSHKLLKALAVREPYHPINLTKSEIKNSLRLAKSTIPNLYNDLHDSLLADIDIATDLYNIVPATWEKLVRQSRR